MKNLFISSLLLLCSYSSFSQTENIEIINNTGCITYLTLALSDPATPCARSYQSTTIGVNPGTTTYTYNTYPGSAATAPQYFIYANIFYGPALCSPSFVIIGDPCAVPNTSDAIGQYSNCTTMCGQAHVEWQPESNPTGTTVLKIYP